MEDTSIAMAGIFTYGSHISYLLTAAKITNIEGILCFNKQGISYSKSNGNKSILTEFQLESNKLTSTNYYFKYLDGNIFFKTNMDTLKKMSACTQNKSLQITMESAIDNCGIEILKDLLYIKVFSNKPGDNSDDGSMRTICGATSNIETFDNISACFDETLVPNVEIPVLKFSDDCSCIISGKTTEVQLLLYPTGMIVKGNKTGTNTTIMNKYGTIPDYTSDNNSTLNTKNLDISRLDLSGLNLNGLSSSNVVEPTNTNVKFMICNHNPNTKFEITIDLPAIKIFKILKHISYKEAKVKVYIRQDFQNPENNHVEFVTPIGPAPGFGNISITVRDMNIQNQKQIQNI